MRWYTLGSQRGRLATTLFACVALSACSQTTEPTTVRVVTLSPSNLTFSSIGDTAQLVAQARDQSGAVIEGRTFTWQSSDPGVASVAASGLVTAMANGTAVISAGTDGVSGTAPATVAQVAAVVDVTPGGDTLNALGDTVRLTAVARDARGVRIFGRALAWFSSDPYTVTVDGTGLVTAVANGSATVFATSGGAGDSALIRVKQVPTQLAFTVQPTTTAVGLVMAPDVDVTIEDALGNRIYAGTSAVTLSLQSSQAGSAPVALQTANAVEGMARFSGITISDVGTYRLVATSGSLAGTSTPFNVLATPAWIDSLTLSSTRVIINGPSVGYTAVLENGIGRTLSLVGVQAWVQQGSVLRAAGGAMVTCVPTVGDLPPGPCRFRFGVSASNSAYGSGSFVPGPAMARFDLSQRDHVLHTLSLPVTLDTASPPLPPAARIDSVILASTTLTIGGSGVIYWATVTNESPDTLELALQGYIDQGTASRAGGGVVVHNCGADIGKIPPGSCRFAFTLSASNGAGGVGTLVPGSATARFELLWQGWWSVAVDTYKIPVTLVQ